MKDHPLTAKAKRELKPVAYFKRTQGRHGTIKVVSVLKVMSDGRIYNIDLSRMRTSTTKTFGSIPLKLESATKKQWASAFKKLTDHLKVGSNGKV